MQAWRLHMHTLNSVVSLPKLLYCILGDVFLRSNLSRKLLY